MTMDVFLLHRFVFFPLSLTRVLLDLITWVTEWMLIRSRNCLPCASTSCIHPGFFNGVCVAHVFFCLHSVSCVPNVVRVSGMCIIDCPFWVFFLCLFTRRTYKASQFDIWISDQIFGFQSINLIDITWTILKF
jgi:hypothetical protein